MIYTSVFVVSRKILKKEKKKRKHWRCRGLNPGPHTCEARALPLSYIPIGSSSPYCPFCSCQWRPHYEFSGIMMWKLFIFFATMFIQHLKMTTYRFINCLSNTFIENIYMYVKHFEFYSDLSVVIFQDITIMSRIHRA